MQDKQKNNKLQPQEKAGRDINNRSDIPKAHTGSTKGGREGDLSKQMGGSQLSSRDLDASYGKKVGSAKSISDLKNNQSGTSGPAKDVEGVADDTHGDTANKPRDPQNKYGKDLQDENTGNNATKRSASGQSHT